MNPKYYVLNMHQRHIVLLVWRFGLRKSHLSNTNKFLLPGVNVYGMLLK